MSRLQARLWSATLLCVLALSGPAWAQANEDCLVCHEDPDATGERNGREISVYVDESLYADSAHADIECVMCHMDLMDTEFGHDEEVEPVDCSMCHDDQSEQHARSLHGRAAAKGDPMAPTCSDCHGTHHILSHFDARSPTATSGIPLLCGSCHREGSEVTRTHNIPQDKILENYSMSIHGEGLFKKGLTVTAVCTSCHTSHQILPHIDPDSSIHRDNIAETCAACHTNIEAVHEKVVEGRLWEEEPGAIPACVECHAPHKIRNVVYQAGAANKNCLECHADESLTMERDGQRVSIHVDESLFNGSVHSGTACAQCHTEVKSSLRRPCAAITKPVDCAVCHADQVQQWATSSHGAAAAKGDEHSPGCIDCHGKHDILHRKLPASKTYARNIPDLCGSCHNEGSEVAMQIQSDIPNPVQSYNHSIHGTGLVESGLVVTATCTDCHGPHMQLPTEDPRSLTHPENVSETCGTCHAGILQQFRESIHSASFNGGTDKKLPTCENCHTSHEIQRTDNVDFRYMMMDHCGDCHLEQTETFFDTFHGKVSRLGDSAAATCYDCHGTHNILPTSYPDSTLSARHIVETCASCHPGAHRQFAGYLTHATHHDQEKYPYLFYSFWFMTALLVGTLTFFTIHTLAWLFRLWRTREDWRHHAKPKPGEKLYQRFTPFQRGMHLAMLLSFFTLAITGMILKFSYATWAQVISDAIGGFATTGVLHRVGAVVLIVVFAIHIRDLIKKRREKDVSWFKFIFGPDSMMFHINDIKEFIGSMKWFLGMGPRPNYGRFTYWEKFDYFAVFWGVFVIGSTGLLLWFPETFTYVLPGWMINVSTIIHSDEALLAVGFIFTIHFFNTHFRPDKFPMDPVIFTGRVPLEELKHDKPREYEELMASPDKESRLVDPFPEKGERWWRVFGFTALFIGLTLIFFIVYSMLFGYR